MNWTLQTQPVTGGTDFLNVTPTTGGASIGGGAGSPFTVSINPVKLALLHPGQYFESVRVIAPTAANNPQVVTVGLNVLPAAAPAVVPAGLLITGLGSRIESPCAASIDLQPERPVGQLYVYDQFGRLSQLVYGNTGQWIRSGSPGRSFSGAGRI